MAGNLSVFDVADYFLVTQNQEAEGEDLITHFKLHTLCYYAQGLHLAKFGKPLFDEPISAWTHGPVIRPLWEKYRDYMSEALPIPKEIDASKYDEPTQEVLDDVSFTYGQFSAWALRNLTRQELPWSDAYSVREKYPDQTISLGLMVLYFSIARFTQGSFKNRIYRAVQVLLLGMGIIWELYTCVHRYIFRKGQNS